MTTQDELRAAIGHAITGLLDAVTTYAAGQVTLAVTPREAAGEPALDKAGHIFYHPRRAGSTEPAPSTTSPEPAHRHEWNSVELLDIPYRVACGLPPLIKYQCQCGTGWLPSSTEQPAHLHRLRQRLEWPYASYDQAK